MKLLQISLALTIIIYHWFSYMNQNIAVYSTRTRAYKAWYVLCKLWTYTGEVSLLCTMCTLQDIDHLNQELNQV